jgi:hypothetical protein
MTTYYNPGTGDIHDNCLPNWQIKAGAVCIEQTLTIVKSVSNANTNAPGRLFTGYLDYYAD